MNGLLVDVAGVGFGGSGVTTAGEAPSLLTAVVTPVATDPVSVAVALTLGSRASAVHGHSAQAAAVTTARGQQLIGDAAAYSEGEAANAAVLGGGGDGAAVPAAPAAPAVGPAISIPQVSAPVLPALPADGKTIATLIHGGGDGAGLKATADWLSSHADHLSATGADLHAAASGLEGDWASAAATAATGRVRELGAWHETHAGHASSAAQAIHDHLQAYATAKAAIPTPEAFDDNERRLRAAVAANNHPLALGRYTPVINALIAQRAQLNADAIAGYSTYAASAGDHLTGAPMSPAPADTPGIGTGGDGAPATHQPNPGDMSSGDIAAIEAANKRLLSQLKTEYQGMPDGQIKTDRLADITAIETAMGTDTDPRHLLWLARPEDPSQMIPAAIAVGDPFTADHVSVTVPGVSSTTRGALATMTDEATTLRGEAITIARLTGDSQNVATIAWTGYQPPPSLLSPDTPMAGLARPGAAKLETFLSDLDAASRNPGHTTALFGHSYGSLVSGLALRDGASAHVTNAVLYGSPGFGATSTAQLGMTDHNFFVMSAPDDLINPIGATAPLHGWGSDPNDIIWGTDPRYRFPHLQTEAGVVHLPTPGSPAGIDLTKTGSSGHGGYPHQATEQMTGFNLAAVLLNRTDLTVKESPFP